jgi:hypothetical protein
LQMGEVWRLGRACPFVLVGNELGKGNVLYL